MSDKKNKKIRKETKKQIETKNKEMFAGFMVEISANNIWGRFVFCFMMFLKLHPIQKSLKKQIKERRKLIAELKKAGKKCQ